MPLHRVPHKIMLHIMFMTVTYSAWRGGLCLVVFFMSSLTFHLISSKHAAASSWLSWPSTEIQKKKICSRTWTNVLLVQDLIKFWVTFSLVLHIRNKIVTLWVNSTNKRQFHPKHQEKIKHTQPCMCYRVTALNNSPACLLFVHFLAKFQIEQCRLWSPQILTTVQSLLTDISHKPKLQADTLL